MTNLPPLPPTPNVDGPSQSELIPFRSSKINILKSGILIPVTVTAAVSIALFSIGNFYLHMDVVAGYLLFCIFYALYVYSGVRKPIFVYLVPFAILFFELRSSFINIFFFVFRTLLPGGEATSQDFISVFISYFFGAGLMEELLKAVPALIGLFIALRMTNTVPNSSASRFLNWVKVTTPLEGLMVGLAAGAAFIFVETLYQYVPNTVHEVAQKQGLGYGFANGYHLLLPRVLQGVIGHMAWAGITGYFIGLAARYPRSMIKLLAIGWLVAAVLHGMWDSFTIWGDIGLWLAAAPTVLIFIGCLLKAKQLEAVREGAASTDSIIVGGAPLAVAAGTLPEQHATAWGGLSQIIGALIHPKVATATPGAFPVGAPAAPAQAAPPQAATPQATPQVAPSAAPVARYILSNGAERYGIVAGQTIDLAMLFPGRGLPAGTLAEVTVHPQDPQAIGLKNMTSGVWTVILDTGATTTVAAGRSVKLVANEKIKVGDVTIDVQAV